MEGERLLIPELPGKIKSVKLFDSGEKVAYKKTDSGILLNIPKKRQNKINTIVVIET